MFGLSRKKRLATKEPVLAAILPEATVVEAATSSALVEQLQRWMSLAEVQQRVIQALVSEVSQASSFVETEADGLSGRFQTLAYGAQQQTKRIDSLTNLAMGVHVEGETVSMDEIASLLETTLSDVVAKILVLSKASMSMVYSLSSLSSNAGRIENCLGGINNLNNVTNMLALNARIEAERAGDAGLTFRVVADEVRDLSKSINSLSNSMTSELKLMVGGVTTSQEILEQVATVDMSQNIMVKERLDVLLPTMLRHNGELNVIVAEALKESEAISADVAAIVTGIQFQDRTKQRLEHVVDTLRVLGEAAGDLQRSTAEVVPELAGSSVLDTEWIKSLLARYTMSEMRERFVAHLLDGKSDVGANETSAADAPSDSGSIELF